jgi:hypothetical protein
MDQSQPPRTVRVVLLLAIILNVAFNYFYQFLPLDLEDMKTASQHYPNLFTPAPYAFSIWGAIYLSWIFYAVYALLPGQRRNALHDRLAKPLILINLLASAWILQFTAGYIGLSLLLILAMLFTGGVVFMRVRHGAPGSPFLFIPFSLFLGWITVANLANLSAWLSLRGWRGGALGEGPWTILLIAFAAVCGLVVGYRYREAVYPLVIAWAALAIGVKQNGETPPVAMAAFAAAALMTAWSVVGGIRSLQAPRRA